jgi:hypothetical protein
MPCTRPRGENLPRAPRRCAREGAIAFVGDAVRDTAGVGHAAHALRGGPVIARSRLVEAGHALARYAAREPSACEAMNVFSVATALAFIDDSGRVRRQRRLTPASRSSYTLKHVAENWGRTHHLESYVSTSDMIAAAAWRGIPFERQRHGVNHWVALRLVRQSTHRQAVQVRPQLRLVRGGAA